MYLFPFNSSIDEKNILADTLISLFSFKNLSAKLTSRNGIFDPSYYSRGYLQKEIDKIMAFHKFDAIYSDSGMAGYVARSELRKIVEPLDSNYKNWLQYFHENNFSFLKIYWFSRYLQTFYRETKIYRNFDFCVMVTENDKKCLEKYLSNLTIVPNGVDIGYFKPMSLEKEHPSLVFVGAMNGEKNIEAIVSFYHKLFPLIKEKFPEIKLYVVGKDPDDRVCELSKDSSVLVTGFVEDLRPYIARCSVFICPHISGSGIKNKVLEAMAMGMPVVSTSIGALGINISPNKNIAIADTSEDFVKWILTLLNDRQLREEMGHNARLLVENNYSWNSCSDKIELLLKGINAQV